MFSSAHTETIMVWPKNMRACRRADRIHSSTPTATAHTSTRRKKPSATSWPNKASSNLKGRIMRLGAVTYNVLKDWDLETIIKNLTDAGFEAVELRTGHKHGVEPSINAAERQRVSKLFERSKVRLLSYGTTCEFESPDPAVRKENVATAKSFIHLAHDTGAWGVKVRPNGFPKDPNVSHETTIVNIGEALPELAAYGPGYGAEIWLQAPGRQTQ